jgi:hypothetical protein
MEESVPGREKVGKKRTAKQHSESIHKRLSHRPCVNLTHTCSLSREHEASFPATISSTKNRLENTTNLK